MSLMNVTSNFAFNLAGIRKVTQAERIALEKTAEALRTEVVQAQVIPKDTGALQESAAIVDNQSESGRVEISMNTPYARRLYFHPEYNFGHVDNANAKGLWFEDWLSGGAKEDFAQQAFAAFMKLGLR